MHDEFLKTDAGQLPYISIVGGAAQAAPQQVVLHFHARRPPACEARFGPSRLELESSSMTVPCGQRTELRLKIVSKVFCTDHKRGKTFDWNEHKKALLKANLNPHPHPHPHPNPNPNPNLR